MEKKIKKALNAAMQKVSQIGGLRRFVGQVGVDTVDASNTQIYVYVEDEQSTTERVEKAKANIDYRKRNNMQYRPYSDDYYEYIFGECVEPNDIHVTVEVWERGWGLRECWYFVGNRANWYNKVYRVCFDKKGTSLVDFDMSIPRSYGWEPFFNFVKAVYKALTIQPELFETYYKYQVVFSWKKGKMVYKLESVDGYEYERID